MRNHTFVPKVFQEQFDLMLPPTPAHGKASNSCYLLTPLQTHNLVADILFPALKSGRL